jgi:hypothetical protein
MMFLVFVDSSRGQGMIKGPYIHAVATISALLQQVQFQVFQNSLTNKRSGCMWKLDGRPSLFMPQVMALLNEHAAAALQYGIDRKFENETKNVLLYDVGANSVRASVEQYSAYKGKDRGRSAVISQFRTTGIRWDDQLGGQAMEGRLVEHFADEFNHKVRGPTSLNARIGGT